MIPDLAIRLERDRRRSSRLARKWGGGEGRGGGRGEAGNAGAAAFERGYHCDGYHGVLLARIIARRLENRCGSLENRPSAFC